jgi:hypothetical protein
MAKQTFLTGDVLTAAAMTSLQQTAMGGGSTTAKTVSYTLVAADAGTVVQMNSASATTITVNTALFAAGDTVQIQNIGAGVCTVTAGTATVNTAGSLALAQYEGGQLYFNTTSAALFFDVVQTGATGGMTQLGTPTTLSGSTTSITGIDQTYRNLYILMTGISYSATAGAYTIIKPNGTNNTCSVLNVIGTSATVNTQASAASNILFNYNNWVLNNTNNAGVLIINNYASTTNYKPYQLIGQYVNNSSITETINGAGNVITNTAVSSLLFSADTSTFNGGTVTVYGVK